MKKRFFVLFLLFSLFIAGCQTGQEANADFNTFCMETFRSYAASDSLTLNYTLMSPKKYGITDLPDGFSSFSLHDLKQMQTSTENTLARLRSFASKNLSREDRLLYDTLDASLTLSQEDIRMLAHSYSFDPSSGIQAQLPVLLCEFILTDKQDYDQYFSLLKSIPAYFNSLISLEKFKKKKGTLPSATTIRHTIRQCQEFIDSSGTDAIEKSFEKSINSASFFSASENLPASTGRFSFAASSCEYSGISSNAAVTSTFPRTNNFARPFGFTFLIFMTMALFPNSFFAISIASFSDFAKNFLIITLPSPSQLIVIQHRNQFHYMTIHADS